MVMKVIERLSYAGCILSQASVFVLMVLGLVVVVLRKFTSYPFLGGINLSTFFLVGLVYLVLAEVQREKGHIVVDLLVTRLRGGVRKVLTFFQLFFSLAITVIISWTCWDYAIESFEVRERIDGAPYYPLYPVKIVIAVGIFLLLLQIVVDVVKAFRGLREKQGGRRHSE